MLVGHSKQKKYFDSLIINGMLSHAYLFAGPEMIGKKAFAIELAKNVLGEKIDQNPDFKLIIPRSDDEESKIYIENIRELKKFVSFKAYNKERRIIILDDVHCLTHEAANAFLKILEEPPAGSLIILISSAPGLIMPTILSRCEKVKFTTLTEKEIAEYLEDRKIKQEDKEFLIKLTRGRIGLIARIIQDGSIEGAKKSIDDLRKMINSGIYERMDYARNAYEKGDYKPKVNYWLNWVATHLSNSPKNGKIVRDLLALNQIVSQPQYNHRLALENFILNL